MVLWSLVNSKGGEILVPKLKSYNIIDFAKAIDDKILSFASESFPFKSKEGFVSANPSF